MLFRSYINKNLLWDPNRILNIWVNDEIYGTNAYAPAYILDNGTAVPGLKMNSVATADEVSFTSYREVGITLTVSSIFSINKGGYEYYLGWANWEIRLSNRRALISTLVRIGLFLLLPLPNCAVREWKMCIRDRYLRMYCSILKVWMKSPNFSLIAFIWREDMVPCMIFRIILSCKPS